MTCGLTRTNNCHVHSKEKDSEPLLFWALILTSFIALSVWQNRDRNRELMPYVNATTLTVASYTRCP